MDSLRNTTEQEMRAIDLLSQHMIKLAGHSGSKSVHDHTYVVFNGTLLLDGKEVTEGIFSSKKQFPCKLKFTSTTSPGNKEIIGCGLFLFEDDGVTPIHFSLAFDSFETFPIGRTKDLYDIAWCFSLTRFILLNALICFLVFLFKCKLWRLFATRKLYKDHSSVLSPTYYTCSAFKWGTQGEYAKFSLDPYSYTTIQCPRKDFVAEAKLRLAIHSNKGYAAFYLNAQIKPVSDTTLDIEGSDQAWAGVIKSRVGKIIIHSVEESKNFGSLENAFLMDDKYLENHAPVGSFNRVRWAVYKNVIQYRTQLMV